MINMNDKKVKEVKLSIYNWLKTTGFHRFAESIEERIIGQKELRPLLLRFIIT